MQEGAFQAFSENLLRESIKTAYLAPDCHLELPTDNDTRCALNERVESLTNAIEAITGVADMPSNLKTHLNELSRFAAELERKVARVPACKYVLESGSAWFAEQLRDHQDVVTMPRLFLAGCHSFPT